MEAGYLHNYSYDVIILLLLYMPLYTCSPLPQSDKNIDRVDIYTYEPIEHDIHTDNEAEGEDWTDNLAYGKVESQDETTEPQLQCEAAVFELKGNESYNSVPSISALEEDWTDNLAYGKVESQDEVTESQLQCEAVFQLKGNESYNSVPSIIAQDEGEYSYTAFSYESPAHVD